MVSTTIGITAVAESGSKIREPRFSDQVSFEDLLATDIDASLIWRFVKKYNILENIDLLNSSSHHLKCVEELNADHELIKPYLFNLTLKNVTNIIFYSGYKIHGTNLAYAEELEANISQLLTDENMYDSVFKQTLREMVGDNQTDLVCFKNSSCSCLSSHDLELYDSHREDIMEKNKNIVYFRRFGAIVDPIIRTLVIIIGMVLNVPLLITFIKEKSVRIESNICIFNLVVNNLLVILIYTPLQYVHKYHHYSLGIEYSFHVFETLTITVHVFIVLMLSVQRYLDVCRAVRPNVDGYRFSPNVRCYIYSSFIWVTSIVITAFVCSHHFDILHGIQTVFYLIGYLLVLAILLLLFNSLTSRKLQRMLESGQTSIENEIITSSTVVLAMTATYYVVFTLFLMYLPFEMYHGEFIYQYFFSLRGRIFSIIFHNMFTLYPSLIVLALYRSSSMFRKYLRKYLFRCWVDSESEKYVTMSSLKTEET